MYVTEYIGEKLSFITHRDTIVIAYYNVYSDSDTVAFNYAVSYKPDITKFICYI